MAEVQEDLLEALRALMRDAKRLRGLLGEGWAEVEEDLVILISDALKAWLRSRGEDPEKASIRIEVEEEEIEVELPRRIERFRL